MASTDKISGKDGTATYNAVTIEITNWEITVESDTKNVTDSSSAAGGWEENIPSGFSRFSGTLEGFVIDGTATPVIGGAAASLVLKSETDISWTGNAILNGKTITTQVHGGEAQKVSVSFVGDGALTEANP